jgi:hypothetical protein
MSFTCAKPRIYGTGCCPPDLIFPWELGAEEVPDEVVPAGSYHVVAVDPITYNSVQIECLQPEPRVIVGS